jgi:hypothetical protein
LTHLAARYALRLRPSLGDIRSGSYPDLSRGPPHYPRGLDDDMIVAALSDALDRIRRLSRVKTLPDFVSDRWHRLAVGAFLALHLVR